MVSAIVLFAIALVDGVVMGVMRMRGTLALPIPVLLIHASMAASAVLMFMLSAH